MHNETEVAAVVRDLANKEVRGLTVKVLVTVVICTVSGIGTMIGSAVYIVRNIDRRDNLNAAQSTAIANLRYDLTTESIERKDKDKEHDSRINNFIDYIVPKR